MNYPFEEIIDKTIVEKNKSEPKRRYLGGSMLGDKCARKIQYRFMGVDIDEERDFSAQTLRIFQFGHSIEDQMADWLRQSGFDLRTEDKNVNDSVNKDKKKLSAASVSAELILPLDFVPLRLFRINVT